MRRPRQIARVLIFVVLVPLAGVGTGHAVPVSSNNSIRLPGGGLGGSLWTVTNHGGTSASTPDPLSNCDDSPGLTILDAQLGGVVSGTAQTDAFDNGAELWLDNREIYTSTAIADVTRRTFRSNERSMANGDLRVAVQYYSAANSATLRTFASFTNPNETPVTHTVSWVSNVGSEGNTGVRGSSNTPSQTFDQTDNWVITSENIDNVTITSRPAITHIYEGPGTPEVRPSAVSQAVFGCPASSNEGVRVDYANLIIPPNSTKNLMFFDQLNRNNDEANQNAVAFNTNPPIATDLLEGLSAKQLSNTVNWKIRFDRFLLAAPGVGGGPHVKGLAVLGSSEGFPDGLASDFINFFSGPTGLAGGAAAAAGEIVFDSNDPNPPPPESEIVTGGGAGGPPIVKVFKVDYKSALVTQTAQFLAYDEAFTGGIRVAVGNVDGSAGDEIVTSAGPGGGPHIKIFKRNADGGFDTFASFFAYDGQFRGGVDVAVGDVYGDGREEIVTGPGFGGGPHVQVFTVDFDGNVAGLLGQQMGGFYAFDPQFGGGANVAVGNVATTTATSTNAAKSEIIVGAGPGGGPHVKVFRVGRGTFDAIGPGFYPYDMGFRGGVRVAATELDGDAPDELITAPGPGMSPLVLGFDYVGDVATPESLTKRLSFFAYDPAFTGGVWPKNFCPYTQTKNC